MKANTIPIYYEDASIDYYGSDGQLMYLASFNQAVSRGHFALKGPAYGNRYCSATFSSRQVKR